VSWLRERSSNHMTLRFWLSFLLDHYPAYLGFRMGTRVRDYALRTAALREAAPIFILTQKVRYQRLCATHISHVTRMTDGDLRAAGTSFSVSFGGREHHNVALDEYQEMTNKLVKSAIGRITPGFTRKLAPIYES
ncbi:unnamed protein product, partial [Sphacelaria rigidula]